MSPTSYQLLYPAMWLDYKGKHYFWFCKLLLNFFLLFPCDDHDGDGDERYDYAYYDIECQGLTEENGSYGD